MDSFTQIALGAAVAHVTLPKSLGKHRLWIGALWATLPDLDVYIAPLIVPKDPLAEVQFHRGFSHSVPFFLLLSGISAFFLKKILKQEKLSYFLWYWSIFLILLTHSLLDIFTTWGTQLLWPLPIKFDLHSVFVVDPLYTLPLVLGLVFYYSKKHIKWIHFGLVLSSLYLLIGLGIQWYITQIITKDEQLSSVKVEKITVKPTAFNCILWNVIVETPDAFLLNQYSLNDSYVESMKTYDKNKQVFQELPIALQNQFIDITQGQYTIQKNENGYVLNDLRFGLLKDTETEQQFAFSYRITQQKGQWVVEEVKKDKRDGKAMLLKMMSRMRGI